MQRHEHHQDEVDERFDALLARCWDEYLVKQETFSSLIGRYKTWHYEHETCTLTLRGLWKSRSFRYTPIATYLPDSENWCWAWANDALPELARSKGQRIKALAEETQYQIFAAPWFEAEAEEVDQFCALALYAVQGIGVFKSKDEIPWTYLAVERDPSG
jgi:hypothetical protein